jgi:hypothetical protein
MRPATFALAAERSQAHTGHQEASGLLVEPSSGRVGEPVGALVDIDEAKMDAMFTRKPNETANAKQAPHLRLPRLLHNDMTPAQELLEQKPSHPEEDDSLRESATSKSSSKALVLRDIDVLPRAVIAALRSRENSARASTIHKPLDFAAICSSTKVLAMGIPKANSLAPEARNGHG